MVYRGWPKDATKLEKLEQLEKLFEEPQQATQDVGASVATRGTAAEGLFQRLRPLCQPKSRSVCGLGALRWVGTTRKRAAVLCLGLQDYSRCTAARRISCR